MGGWRLLDARDHVALSLGRDQQNPVRVPCLTKKPARRIPLETVPVKNSAEELSLFSQHSVLSPLAGTPVLDTVPEFHLGPQIAVRKELDSEASEGTALELMPLVASEELEQIEVDTSWHRDPDAPVSHFVTGVIGLTDRTGPKRQFVGVWRILGLT